MEVHSLAHPKSYQNRFIFSHISLYYYISLFYPNSPRFDRRETENHKQLKLIERLLTACLCPCHDLTDMRFVKHFKNLARKIKLKNYSKIPMYGRIIMNFVFQPSQTATFSTSIVN